MKATRFLLVGLTAASVVLCAGATIVWVRSYSTSELVTWQRAAGDSLLLGACGGQVMVGHSLYPGIDDRRRHEPAGMLYSARAPGRYDAGIPLDGCRTMQLHEGAPYRRLAFDSRTYYDHSGYRTFVDYAGFAYQQGLLRAVDSRGQTLSVKVSSRIVLLPCWSLALAFAAGPVFWVARIMLRRHKTRPGTGFDVSAAAAKNGTGSEFASSGGREDSTDLGKDGSPA